MKKLLVSVLVMLAISTATFAVPGLFDGATGGLMVKSGTVTKAPVVSTYVYNDMFGDWNTITLFNNIQAAFPAGKLVKGLDDFELSTALYDLSGGFNSYSIGAKYALPLGLEELSVAAGINYWEFIPVNEPTTDIYAAATYDFGELPLAVSGNLGYNFDIKDVYFGLNAEYDFGKITAGIEYMSEVSFLGDDSRVNIYATTSNDKGLGVTAALVDISGDGSWFYDKGAKAMLGLNYTF